MGSLSSLYFTDFNTGYTVGSDAKIMKTVNGGTNWTPQSNATSTDLYSVYFTSASTGYAAGSIGTILKTTNGGTNWTAQSSGTSVILLSVFFTDSYTGYAVGGNGTILKTTTGGWNSLLPQQLTGDTEICQPTGTSQYSTTGAAGATSYIWRVTHQLQEL